MSSAIEGTNASHWVIFNSNNVILKFPDEMSVYPGHGPSTTIGDERKTNPYLQDL